MATNDVAAPAGLNGASRPEVTLHGMRDEPKGWLAWLTTELTALGVTRRPSVGTFILIHFPDEPRHSAALADDYLSARG